MGGFIASNSAQSVGPFAKGIRPLRDGFIASNSAQSVGHMWCHRIYYIHSFIASNSAQSVGLNKQILLSQIRVSSPLIRLNPWDVTWK